MTCLRLAASCEDDPPQAFSDTNGWALYRDRTVALLRRYLRMSLDLGRVPSLLGGELFRARVTAYKALTFEERVLFVHDMESCLRRLDPLSRLLLAKITLQRYKGAEVAQQIGANPRRINRRHLVALDRITEILATYGLLEPFDDRRFKPNKRRPRVDVDHNWLN